MIYTITVYKVEFVTFMYLNNLSAAYNLVSFINIYAYTSFYFTNEI